MYTVIPFEISLVGSYPYKLALPFCAGNFKGDIQYINIYTSFHSLFQEVVKANGKSEAHLQGPSDGWDGKVRTRDPKRTRKWMHQNDAPIDTL